MSAKSDIVTEALRRLSVAAAHDLVEGVERNLKRAFPKVAVLIHLDVAELATVEELVVDAWLCMAPPKLAAKYAADHGLG